MHLEYLANNKCLLRWYFLELNQKFSRALYTRGYILLNESDRLSKLDWFSWSSSDIPSSEICKSIFLMIPNSLSNKQNFRKSRSTGIALLTKRSVRSFFLFSVASVSFGMGLNDSIKM